MGAVPVNGKSWTGGVVWREGVHSPAGKAPFPTAELTLSDEGGHLSAGPTFPRGLVVDHRFSWGEVEKAQRVLLLGMPFLGEAARFTLKEAPSSDGPRIFLFFTARKRRTLEMLDLGERGGARAERRARIRFIQP